MEDKVRFKSKGGSTTFVKYCPGNMTKYLLIVSSLEGAEDHCNSRILSWINARKCMEIPDFWCKHTNADDETIRSYAYYIGEKLDCGMGDAMPIARCVLEEML